VWLVELTPLADPSLVPQGVASTLGVSEQPGRSPTDALSDYLGSKNALLVLDNCEHLIEACAELAEALLRFCPGLRVLATSREALGITGEVAWPVPSLTLPDLRRVPDIGSLREYESARLFVERAVAANPTFALTEQNASAVAQVCYQLDGIFPGSAETGVTRSAGATSCWAAAPRTWCSGRRATTHSTARTGASRSRAATATTSWSAATAKTPWTAAPARTR
jgi:predicted ATPase